MLPDLLPAKLDGLKNANGCAKDSFSVGGSGRFVATQNADGDIRIGPKGPYFPPHIPGIAALALHYKFNMRNSRLTFALLGIFMPIFWSVTAFAGSNVFASQPSFIFVGEDHEDPTQNRIFEELTQNLVSQGLIDSIGTEAVPDNLNNDFQNYLSGSDEDDRAFLDKLKYNPLLRQNMESKIKTLFRIGKAHPGQIKFCGIEATAVEHLSENPTEQLNLVRTRINTIDRSLVTSASKSFGIDIRTFKDPTANLDRETKITSNIMTCKTGRKTVLVHVGSGHILREDRSKNPWWRSALDLLEDYDSSQKAVSIRMINVSGSYYRDFKELDSIHPFNLIPLDTMPAEWGRRFGKNVLAVDFLLPTHEFFERR